MGEGRHDDSEPRQAPRPIGQRLLDWVERQGNKLSDPALLFVYALLTTWLLSAWLDGLSFELPSKMGPRPHQVVSQLTGVAFSGFLADMLLVDGDPLNDPSVLLDRAKLRVVMKDGQMHKAAVD